MKKHSDRIFLLLGVFFLCCFLITGFMLVKYFLAYRSEKSMEDELITLRNQEIEERQEEEINVSDDSLFDDRQILDASELKAINEDYVAYLTIPDLLSYPIVKGKNEYYLKHDFYNKNNSHGAIFLDENCEIVDDYILVHGHHMKDGTMFGCLKKYKKKEFCESNKSLFIDFGLGDEEYEIFMAGHVDLTKEDYFHYENMPKTKEEKESYLKKLKSHSFYYKEKEEIADSQVVILSTCDYGTDDERLIVGFVKK